VPSNWFIIGSSPTDKYFPALNLDGLKVTHIALNQPITLPNVCSLSFKQARMIENMLENVDTMYITLILRCRYTIEDMIVLKNSTSAVGAESSA
jgi:hypothetical protein